jgi:hypothetical protein
LRVLTPDEGYDDGPIRSGFCATLQYGQVVDEVVFMLVGVSQLATGEDGTVRLSLANPARHYADLRGGLEFDILDHQQHRICRGTVVKVLGKASGAFGKS